MCYIFHKDEYVQLAAKHYYIQFSLANNRSDAQKVVEECVPIHLIEDKSMSEWIQLVSTAHLEVLIWHVKKKKENCTKKWSLVDYVRFSSGLSRQQEQES